MRRTNSVGRRRLFRETDLLASPSSLLLQEASIYYYCWPLHRGDITLQWSENAGNDMNLGSDTQMQKKDETKDLLYREHYNFYETVSPDDTCLDRVTRSGVMPISWKKAT